MWLLRIVWRLDRSSPGGRTEGRVCGYAAGLSGVRGLFRVLLLLPCCYHFTPHEGESGVSAPMADRRFLVRLGRPRAAQFANRPGS